MATIKGELVIRTITIGKIERLENMLQIVIREGNQVLARFRCSADSISDIVTSNINP